MGRKAKYSSEQKVKACEDYLSGRRSAILLEGPGPELPS